MLTACRSCRSWINCHPSRTFLCVNNLISIPVQSVSPNDRLYVKSAKPDPASRQSSEYLRPVKHTRHTLFLGLLLSIEQHDNLKSNDKNIAPMMLDSDRTYASPRSCMPLRSSTFTCPHLDWRRNSQPCVAPMGKTMRRTTPWECHSGASRGSQENGEEADYGSKAYRRWIGASPGFLEWSRSEAR